MSEIQSAGQTRNWFDTGNSRYGDWQSLRLLVKRDSSQYLTVALIEVPKGGHPRLDARYRGHQVLWDPRTSEGDVRLYALSVALSGMTQTRP